MRQQKYLHSKVNAIFLKPFIQIRPAHFFFQDSEKLVYGIRPNHTNMCIGLSAIMQIMTFISSRALMITII